MRNQFLLIASFLFIGCGQVPLDTQNTPREKLSGTKFLVAGQSNSVSPSNGYPNIYSKTGLVSINDYYFNPTVLRVPTASDSNNSGMTWIKLGDLLNRKISFNIVGVGGTSTRQWVNTYHQRIVDALNKETYTAILWVQGESDLSLSEEESYQNLKTIVEESRTIQPNIVWYVALDGHSGARPARTAQLRLIIEGVVYQGADLDELRKTPSFFDSSLAELEGNGWDAYAQAWYEILIKDL